ncbi:hypothetical protein [Gloeocapsopsis sp. IPPAS B-1203]|uniref:hypothetical protein n=1 Tax=Gloeocapsopsis sp. IPPAS B-1203 TaxID=2049454 RepID=UPI00259FED84|nr:hypothetical protein [Gloeocapsopsis sp. IPPAS B-1203]
MALTAASRRKKQYNITPDTTQLPKTTEKASHELIRFNMAMRDRLWLNRNIFVVEPEFFICVWR